MPLTKEQVRHVAALARLNLTDTEVSKFADELTVILDYFGSLQEVDTDGIEIRSEFVSSGTKLREDATGECLDRNTVLQNAPRQDGEFFLVPKVIGS